MAEPFDTLAAQQVAIFQGLMTAGLTPAEAIDELSAINETLSLNAGTLEAVKATLGRVRGMFVVSAPPSDFLGVPGSTAFDPTNRIWYGPKDAVTGWPDGVPFIDQGPAGQIVSVSTELIGFGEDVEVVAGGTAEERTLTFRLPDTTNLTAALIDILGRADLYEMDRTYDATQFLSRGIELLFTEDYYRIGTEVEGDITDLTGFACTRATVGYAKRLNGTYQAFAVNEPRITDAGITVEPSATNLLLRSAEFDNASWTKNAAGTAAFPVVTANDAAAPDGTLTADKVVMDRGSGGTLSDRCWVSSIFATTAGALYTGSVFVKGEPGKVIGFRHVGGITYSLHTFTGGWDRIVTTETAAGTAGSMEITLRGGVGTSEAATFHVWGAQVEAGSLCTTPIVTTGAAATRAADRPSQAAEIPVEHTVILEFVPQVSLAGAASYPRYLAEVRSPYGADNYNHIFQSGPSGTLRTARRVAGVSGPETSFGAVPSIGQVGTVAAAYTPAGCRGSLDGAAVVAGTYPTPPLVMQGLDIGHINGGQQHPVVIRRIVVIPVALSDAQLQALTAA